MKFYSRRFEKFKSLPSNEQRYCKTCSLLLLDQFQKHSSHTVFEKVSIKQLMQPSLLFEKYENKKVEAVEYNLFMSLFLYYSLLPA